MDKDLYNKLKEYSSEVHTKLVYSITGKRVGAIRDLHLCMRETDLILDYITNLEQQLKKKDEIINKAIEYIKETSIGSILEVHCGCEENYIEPLLQILEDKEADINVGEVE